MRSVAVRGSRCSPSRLSEARNCSIPSWRGYCGFPTLQSMPQWELWPPSKTCSRQSPRIRPSASVRSSVTEGQWWRSEYSP